MQVWTAEPIHPAAFWKWAGVRQIRVLYQHTFNCFPSCTEPLRKYSGKTLRAVTALVQCSTLKSRRWHSQKNLKCFFSTSREESETRVFVVLFFLFLVTSFLGFPIFLLMSQTERVRHTSFVLSSFKGPPLLPLYWSGLLQCVNQKRAATEKLEQGLSVFFFPIQSSLR